MNGEISLRPECLTMCALRCTQADTGTREIAVPVTAFVAPDIATQREQFILANKARLRQTRLINEWLLREFAMRKVPSQFCWLLNSESLAEPAKALHSARTHVALHCHGITSRWNSLASNEIQNAPYHVRLLTDQLLRIDAAVNLRSAE